MARSWDPSKLVVDVCALWQSRDGLVDDPPVEIGADQLVGIDALDPAGVNVPTVMSTVEAGLGPEWLARRRGEARSDAGLDLRVVSCD
jgi:hypothetical protein